jgi:hypothetical protein
MSQDYDESLDWLNNIDPEDVRREANLLINSERRLRECGINHQDDVDLGLIYLILGKMLITMNDGSTIVVSDNYITDY